MQARKTQSFRRIDAQLQRQNQEMITQRPPTARKTAAGSLQQITATTKHLVRQELLQTHPSTIATTLANVEEPEQEENVETTQLSTRRSKKTRKFSTSTTTDTELEIAATTLPSTKKSKLIQTASTTPAVQAEKLPRTWSLPENDSESSADPVVLALEAQLQENWKKLDKFQENWNKKTKTHKTIFATTRKVPVVTTTESELNGSSEDDTLEDDTSSDTTAASTRHRRVAPLKKASFTDEKFALKITQKQPEQDQRTILSLGALRMSFQDKLLAMDKRDMPAARSGVMK